MSEREQKRILIVEDEKAYSRALVLKLQNSNFQVESVTNGEEALDVMANKKFDLILSDLVMPKMNGFQMLEEMKKKSLKIPVIGLSNLSQTDDEEKMLNAGAVDFLSKSNTPIIEVIKKINDFFIKK